MTTQLQAKLLGELLCEKSFLEDDQLQKALAEQKGTQQRLGQILLEMGHITQIQLNEALALQAGIERIDLENISVNPQTISLIPAELVSKYNILPLWQENGQLGIAMANPFDTQAVEDLRMITGLSIKRYFGHPMQMEQVVIKFYGSNVARMLENLAPADQSQDGEENGDLSAAKLHELAREPSLVNLVNLILLEAVDARASDVHIEPFEHQLKIKYRVDGMLFEKAPSPKRLQAAIISRIKIMAGMNIAERFIPQDGHIEFSGHTGKVDIRVSTVPTVYGESITMRLLDRSASLIELEDLGMGPVLLSGVDNSLYKSHGMILVTGPTGSGKTTTLYAALNKIYSPTKKMITIEDPVEYQLDGIIQMPVNPKRGLTFASGLRHIVRQDPDIIMVGEIRDLETADIAIRSALTGHLVFSTLHTNDAPGAVTRLIDMGVEPFLLASSIEVIMAQRLVRKICRTCKEPYTPDVALLSSLKAPELSQEGVVFYRGTGCPECMQSGMRGRVGLFELLRITDQLRPMISAKADADAIAKAAPDDHKPMRHDGIDKIIQGVTTPEEVLRVTQGLDEI
ncbi:MAG: Flp pilus assembly complex ATPase component [Planctomycetes bacterium]|nr:Flp pilus assembly complex ATPase component [Planctomycetota bacterium]